MLPRMGSIEDIFGAMRNEMRAKAKDDAFTHEDHEIRISRMEVAEVKQLLQRVMSRANSKKRKR